ncbi:MAG: hypothetical protein RIQ93_2865 [Verrucomicrobiota bacterium]|jgi:diacylglycerol kinase family enzyme
MGIGFHSWLRQKAWELATQARRPGLEDRHVMHAILVLNHRAGSLQTQRDGVTPANLSSAFAEAGMPVDIRPVGERDLAVVLREAVAERPRALLVGGGDGTVSAAAGHLAHTGIPLGVLPLGTLNHFAKDLGAPDQWREAVVRLANAPIRAVDVGEVNGRVFINNCSIGSYAEAVRRRDALRARRGYRKWTAMFLAAWGVFRRLRRIRVEIHTPDGHYKRRTPFICVSNNRYAGQLFDPALRERLDEGQVCIYTTRAVGSAAVLRMFWQSLVRRIDQTDALEIFCASRATVILEENSVPAACDGELLPLRSPLHFRIRSGALNVLSPVR